MRSFLLLSLVVVLIASTSGCEQENRRLIYLTHHFREHDLTGRHRKLGPEVIGAAEACRFSSREEQFNLEFARFENAKDAARLAQTGFKHPGGATTYKVHANGNFAMIIRAARDEEKILNIFNDF